MRKVFNRADSKTRENQSVWPEASQIAYTLKVDNQDGEPVFALQTEREETIYFDRLLPYDILAKGHINVTRDNQHIKTIKIAQFPSFRKALAQGTTTPLRPLVTEFEGAAKSHQLEASSFNQGDELTIVVPKSSNPHFRLDSFLELKYLQSTDSKMRAADLHTQKLPSVWRFPV